MAMAIRIRMLSYYGTLLLCLYWHGVTKLAKDWRTCACGRAGGKYLADGLNAEITDNANTMCLGFHNGKLLEAIAAHNIKGDRPDGLGRDFLAFIIPEAAKTVKRI